MQHGTALNSYTQRRTHGSPGDRLKSEHIDSTRSVSRVSVCLVHTDRRIERHLIEVLSLSPFSGEGWRASLFVRREVYARPPPRFVTDRPLVTSALNRTHCHRRNTTFLSGGPASLNSVIRRTTLSPRPRCVPGTPGRPRQWLPTTRALFHNYATPAVAARLQRDRRLIHRGGGGRRAPMMHSLPMH